MATLIQAQGVPATASPLSYNDNRPGTLSFTSPRAAYSFVGGQGDLVTVKVSPLASAVDPKVTVYDPNGQLLLQNDNGPFDGKPDSFVSLFLPQTGPYTVVVESASSATGDFLIQLTGRSPVKSHRLEFGVPVEVDVRTDPLPVYFTFKANADCPTTLTVYNVSAGLPYTFPFTVIVRDEDGTPVEQLQGGRMTENRMTVHNQPDTSPTAGLYEVEVSSADPAVAGSLYLVVTCADQEPACFVPPGLTGTPTPPPPTYDPCELGEILIKRPEGPVVISGQNDYDPGQKLVPNGGGGQVQLLGEASLTPSPTLPTAPLILSTTPCTPTPIPPCLSPLEQAETQIAPTFVAIQGTLNASDPTQAAQLATQINLGPTAVAIVATINAQPNPCATPTVPPCLTLLDQAGTEIAPTIAALAATYAASDPTQVAMLETQANIAPTVIAKLTQIAGQPDPCGTPTPQIPTVTPCPTDSIKAVLTTHDATATQQALIDRGCATPDVTPCPTGESGRVAIPRFETEIAQTQVAQGLQPGQPCPTPTCPPDDRPISLDAAATARAMGCATPHPTRTPTPTPTCPPSPAGAVVPCNPPVTRTPTPTPDCTPAAATVAVIPCQPLPTPTPGCAPTPVGAVIPCEPTLPPPAIDCTPTAAALLVVPCATATCPPNPAGAILPCNQTPTPDCTPARNLIAGAQPCQPPATPTCPPAVTPDRTRLNGANPCPIANACPTPGGSGLSVGVVASENTNQASSPSNDLGILVTAVPCAPPMATPTATRRVVQIPQADCSGFALTSPTDGLPNGGVTVYWNAAPGATGYRVNVYNDANALKQSVNVPGNQTSVGIDVSEGAVGPGYTFTIQVQALFNGRVGCASSKTENRVAPPNGGGDNSGDRPKPTCPALTAGVPNCR